MEVSILLSNYKNDLNHLMPKNSKMTLHCLYHTLQNGFYNKIKIEFSRLILTGNKEVEEALECEL